MGVCGKDPRVAALQDILIYQLKGIGWLAHHARGLGKTDDKINRFTVKALFTTVTNVDFDPERLIDWIREGGRIRKVAENLYCEAEKKAGGEPNREEWPACAKYNPAETTADLPDGNKTRDGIGVVREPENEDIRSLKELLTYGLKGMAAYVDHAGILGREEDEMYAFFHQALSALTHPAPSMDALLGLNMECGRVNLRAMELLDAANTERFGDPEPTPVTTGLKKGPAIIISGHDLLDLEELLKQTEGTGVNVYTHGEMLPAHGYPELKKYKHLAGHFGTAWQNQRIEFDGIPAAILFTTNCIQKPKDSYRDRVFTCGLVAWPEVPHVKDRDFSAVIEKAKELAGFEEREGETLTTGFARNAVLRVADQVIGAVKNGAIRHFFLVGGCDGAKPGRNYYTEFVEKAPKDTVILTLACGKFRFNHLDLGEIEGIPRLLDIGQCNDAYSAVKIAEALASAFNCGINDLPLTLILSWYEQKAVAILLSLLSLGVQGIRIGPSLPAFLSPNVVNFLTENFDLRPIQTPCLDLAEILEEKVCAQG